MMKSRLLILEDEQIIALDLMTSLQEHGYEIVAAATSAEAAIERIANHKIDLMIVDYKLDGPLNGEEAVSAIRSHFGSPIPVIFISGATHSEFFNRMANDPCAILIKPLKFEDLLACIETILKN